MKKTFSTLFCSMLLTFALAAQETAGLISMIPADTKFALGLDTAKLCKHPLIHKFFAEGALVKELEKDIAENSAEAVKSIQYLLILSSDPLSRSVNLLMQAKDTEAIRALLTNDKEVKTVPCGQLTAYRISDSMEFVFPGKNLICASLSSVKNFLDAKKGLPDSFAGMFEKKNENVLVSGFLILTDDIKQEKPFAASLDQLRYSLEAVPGNASDLILRLDAACATTDAANKTMMLVQQLQLLAGFFINTLDPDLAQEFNKSATVKIEGNNVRFQVLITEKLIQKLSVLAEPGVLKNMVADDSDF